MPLSDVQLGGIAVPGNEVRFLCVAFAILSEDEGRNLYAALKAIYEKE